MNETVSTKYGVSPESVENKTIDSSKDSEFNREMYDFLGVKKVDNNYQRNRKYEAKKDRRQKRLRNPLFLDEKVFVLAERLKKKDPLQNFIRLLLTTFLFSIVIKYLQYIKGQNLAMVLICIG